MADSYQTDVLVISVVGCHVQRELSDLQVPAAVDHLRGEMTTVLHSELTQQICNWTIARDILCSSPAIPTYYYQLHKPGSVRTHVKKTRQGGTEFFLLV